MCIIIYLKSEIVSFKTNLKCDLILNNQQCENKVNLLLYKLISLFPKLIFTFPFIVALVNNSFNWGNGTDAVVNMLFTKLILNSKFPMSWNTVSSPSKFSLNSCVYLLFRSLLKKWLLGPTYPSADLEMQCCNYS